MRSSEYLNDATGTSDPNHEASASKHIDVTSTLERFSALTEEIAAAIGREEFEQGMKLLSKRRDVVETLRTQAAEQHLSEQPNVEIKANYQLLSNEIRRKNDEVLSIIGQKRSALLRKLIDLQKFKSYQTYLSQE